MIGQQIAEIVIVKRLPQASLAGPCPRCGSHRTEIDPDLSRAIDVVTAPRRTTEDRSALIVALSDGADSIDTPEVRRRIERGTPGFLGLSHLLPKNRSERIAFAALLIAIASFMNDIHSAATNDALTAQELKDILQDRDRRQMDTSSGGVPDISSLEIIGNDVWKGRPGVDIGRILDGNPETFWETQNYRASYTAIAVLIISITFKSPVELLSATIVSPSTGTVVEVWTWPGGNKIQTVEINDIRTTADSSANPIPVQKVQFWIKRLAIGVTGYSTRINELTFRL